ncbi:hypothetical protein MNBD_GAMMA08-1286 [hydrothermal vent metagenome]|uniref:Uncharacterized protein n=1 Tax=hydrothermal vent metagenome TaxID=652676 RepID=A0A3B0XR62_9ZZZZ
MKNKSCIDEMDELLNQIADFKKLVKSSPDKSDPRFVQEYRLFKQHVEWVSEDLTASSYIVDHPKRVAKH